MNEFLTSLGLALGVDLLKSVIVPCLAAAIHKMDPDKPKKANFSFRLDPDLRERLDKACDAVDEEDTGAVVRACIRAFVDEVEAQKEITKPFAIVGKKRLALLESQAAGPTEEGEAPAVTDPLCLPQNTKVPTQPTQAARAGTAATTSRHGSSTPPLERAPANGLNEEAGKYGAGDGSGKKR